MSGRVNTKFVLILAILLVALTGGVVVFAMTYLKVNPTELIARGDAFAARGEFARAAEQYQKALAKRGNDEELILKFADTVGKIPVDNTRDARERLQQQIQYYNRASEVRPDNPVPVARLLALYEVLGRELQDTGAYDQMVKSSQAALRVTPGMMVAHKYQGIAQVNRMRTQDVPPDQRQDALEKHLSVAAAQAPDDAEVTHHLALWHVFQARKAADTGEAARLRDEAVRTSAADMAKHPGDSQRQWNHAVVLLELDRPKEALEQAAVMEAALLAKPEPIRRVMEVAELIMQHDEAPSEDGGALRRGQVRAEALMRRALAAHPEDLRLRVALGQLLSRRDPPTEAMELLKAAGTVKSRGPAITMMQSSALEASAGVRYAELLIRQADTASEPARREAHLNEAEAVAKRLGETVGEIGAVNLLRGRLAMVRSQPRAALSFLEKASKQFKDQNLDALLLSARACMDTGNLGTAVDRLEKAVRLAPGYVTARLELAKLYTRLNRHDDARRQIDAALGLDAENLDALQLRAAMLADTGQIDQAIAQLEALGPLEKPRTIPLLVQLYNRNEQRDKAETLLTRRLDAEPTDLQALVQLNILDASAAGPYFDKAQAAGVDPQKLALARKSNDPAALVQERERQIAALPDELARHLQLFRLYWQQGEQKEARAALEAAAKAGPDAPGVVEARFELALFDRDWDRAEALAAKARDLNLDQARGASYAGRVELGRGRYDRAVAEFHNALREQSVNSEGWRYLGDALRGNGDLPGAHNAYGRSLEQKPDNIEALRGQATVLEQQGRPSEALALLRKAVGFSPSHRVVLAQYLQAEERNDKTRALEVRQRLAQANPGDADNRRALAVLMTRVDAKRKDEAIKLVGEVVAKEGPSAQSATAVALIHQAAGQPEEGGHSLREYVKARGDKATGEDWLALARYLVLARDPAAGAAAYRQAIALEDPRTRPVTRELADLYFDRGAMDEAIKLYAGLFEGAPDDRVVGQRYAEALLRSGRAKEAEAPLSRLARSNPDEPNTLLLQAIQARGAGDAATAQGLLDRAIEVDPKRPLAYVERADILMQDPGRAQQDRALADLQKAVELAPQHDRARQALAALLAGRGQVPEAEAQLRAVLEKHPDNTAARLQLVNLYLDHQKPGDAASLLEQSARLYPREATWPRLQAQRHAAGGRHDEALAKLRDAWMVASERERPVCLAELASKLLEMNKAGEAAKLLGDQPELVDRAPALLALHGRALTATGQADAAKAAFIRAVETAPSIGQLTLVASQVAQALGADAALTLLRPLGSGPKGVAGELVAAQVEVDHRRSDAALERLKKLEGGIAAGGGEWLVLARLRALALHQNKRYEDALAWYRRVLEAAPGDATALNNSAFLLAENLGRAGEALPLAERAAKASPSDASVLDTLGWVLFLAGRVEEAYEPISRAHDRQPTAVNAYHLGRVQRERGRIREAIAALSQAQRLVSQTKDPVLTEDIDRQLKDIQAGAIVEGRS